MIGTINLVRALPAWAMWAAFAALVAGAFGAGWIRGVDHAEDRHASFVAQVARAGAEQAARTESTIRAHKQLTEDTRNGYAQALDVLHAHYAGRVRNAGAGGGPVPAVPQAAAEPAARPADPGLGAPGGAPESQESGLMVRCAETTLMFLFLRSWVEGL